MNTSPYPIYVISLQRTPERRLYIQRQLNALGLDYQLVDAVDKYDMASPDRRTEIARSLGLSESTIEYYEYIPYFHDHLASALSHVKAYNLMLEQNVSVACILEDDALISPCFIEILHAARKTPWDILMLSSHSRTVRYILAANPHIQGSVESSPEIDCSLFPRLRARKWPKRLLPLASISQSQLDCSFIPKLAWSLLMLLSSSNTSNNIFKYLINIYKSILKLYNPNHYLLYKNGVEANRLYAACKIGGLPIRSSQQPLYKNYDIAIPAELPTSAMAYLLTATMAKKCKEIVDSNPRMLIDAIPWHLHRKDGIRLRIVTPPCVSAALTYLYHTSNDL